LDLDQSPAPSLTSPCAFVFSGRMKTLLFDPLLLESLDFDSVAKQFKPQISLLSPGSGLKLRPLSLSDYDAGYVDLLNQLTCVGEVSKSDYTKRFNEIKGSKDTYYITVVEDTTSGQVIASGTLLIEMKFIHGCALRGRIEDVVVSDKYRGQQLGKVLISVLKLLSIKLDCYKVTLDCRDEMKPFYENLGFAKEETNSNFMQIRFRK